MEAEAEKLIKPTHDEPKTTDNYENNDKTNARRPPGSSLAIAVTILLSLLLAALALFHTAHVAGLKPPTWFRSLALQAVFVGLPAPMGFCSWLVWTDGGFRRKPEALAFSLSYLALSWALDPIVFGLDAPWVGLVVSWAMLGALIGYHLIFKEVNPVAGNPVVVSMIWAVFIFCLKYQAFVLLDLWLVGRCTKCYGASCCGNWPNFQPSKKHSSMFFQPWSFAKLCLILPNFDSFCHV